MRVLVAQTLEAPYDYVASKNVLADVAKLMEWPQEGRSERFEKLAKVWREECFHFSSAREMFQHPAYQQIVGMGPSALPFIFAELARQPDHWFWALRAITQDDPVSSEHRGNLSEMARDWLDWARKRGIRW